MTLEKKNGKWGDLVNLAEVEKYVNETIPALEKKLANSKTSPDKLIKYYNAYVELLRITAPYNFHSYNKYLELDEDKKDGNKGFYHHRKKHLKEVFDAFNDMEIYDKYDMLLVSLPPRVGKTTTGIRFLSWIMGRYPFETQLGTSYSDNITTSFYIGAMEIVQSDRFGEIFPDAQLVAQNAKREEIWLGKVKRYPSITFVPIGGSMTGRTEASKFLYCDDLVSGYEEAVSIVRLQKLWELYTVNCQQRKKDGCKEVHMATKWSVHDVITRLGLENADNPRCKIINLSCYDENGESRFDFRGGFSTQYYNQMEATMDSVTFNALYKQEPIEREGLLYKPDELQYYFELPNDRPDSIIAVIDSKNMGTDYVAMPVGYVYGDMIYIDDAVYNNGLPEVTRELVANKLVEHNVVRADIELNNGGNYYGEDIQELLKSKNGITSIRMFFSGNNKKVKIITYSDYVKKHFIFRDSSTYHPQSPYADFMRGLLTWTQTGSNKNDDAPDSIAMLAQLSQELTFSSIKILNRKDLKL